jgi:RsiW-degrading membrane proteinase PrsW (M82 family)
MLSAALGFATLENISYVMQTKGDINDQLLVLFVRWLCPVHVICAVIQAVNLSKAALRMEKLSLFRVLLPAILVHGSFDFTLFLTDVLAILPDTNLVALFACTITISVLIVIGSTIYACVSFKRLQAAYESRWSSLRADDGEDLVVVHFE